MDQAVIFGAGNMGRKYFYKLSQKWEIRYYIDNNKELQRKKINGVEIISVNKLKKICGDNIKIIICSMSYREMVDQLLENKLYNYLVMLNGLLYSFEKERTLIPQEIYDIKYYKKSRNEKNILFIQDIGCVRTHKIASLMKDNGYNVFLLYLLSPAIENEKQYESTYKAVYTFSSQKGVIDFIKNSEFDIIHSANAPDYLTVLVLNTGKPVIHDCHDMMSLQGYDNYEILEYEYIANTQSAGVIYTSEGVKKIAKKIFAQEDDNIFVLENYITKQLKRTKKYTKLSKLDGEIHCVYEGGIGFNPKSDRYFEVIWKKIADSGVHVHFYSQSDELYCMNLDKKNERFHYEGNKGSKELIDEMTKYDCGLAIFNVNEENKFFLETGTANKIYEYINAGIPVIVGDIETYIEFVEKYKVGIYLDFRKDIKVQLEKASQIAIKDDFLLKNQFTMESKCKKLIEFYEKIISNYYA